ncbi:heparanase-like protein 2 [Macadamia integrifolia]|uniref:heparanase-like protein 2 n=1 Tax=Macadamia integrifolia TaxID=60698 RepID=UPI001C4EE734|nr:heparanase-like protein 2 [Macadamia integrifolia]
MGMSFRLFLFSLLLSQLSIICLAHQHGHGHHRHGHGHGHGQQVHVADGHGLEEQVTVTVGGVTSIAETEDNFVCATLDWWPSFKCNYGQCPWGMAGILNLDLNNKILKNAIKAFNPLRIRVGGSMQDQILYKVGNFSKCPHVKNDTNGLFGFSKGCLTMERWDQLNNLFTQTGSKITFGLNALFGRRKLTADGLYGGNWNPSNARDLIKHTISKGYNVDSWELGNELSAGGVAARVNADQYGRDMIILRNLVDELYKNATTKPRIMGPGGFYDGTWFKTLLQVSGPNVVDVVTHHIYNLGPGKDLNLIYKIQDPFFLNQVAQTYKDIKQTTQSFGPWASVWVGESGGAYNSGGKYVSHTFVNSFWYLDQLGMTSTFNHKAFCRQTLIGGNYGLLNTTTFIPNPDYYGALLWHRLMGPKVLSTNHIGSPYLRAYSHCSRTKGIAILLINMSNSTSFSVSVANDLNLHPESESKSVEKSYREEYHLTPKDGNIQSDVLLLNGSPLVLSKSLDIPPLNPIKVDASAPIKIVADSIVFATLPDFQAPACVKN